MESGKKELMLAAIHQLGDDGSAVGSTAANAMRNRGRQAIPLSQQYALRCKAHEGRRTGALGHHSRQRQLPWQRGKLPLDDWSHGMKWEVREWAPVTVP